ncbi:hypothetical protein EDD22DRAFT_844450 [Suillus occidentalis]|nr:hypothetical protein EDD22DRAFT_844450 [Suillus occidentalis]
MANIDGAKAATKAKTIAQEKRIAKQFQALDLLASAPEGLDGFPYQTLTWVHNTRSVTVVRPRQLESPSAHSTSRQIEAQLSCCSYALIDASLVFPHHTSLPACDIERNADLWAAPVWVGLARTVEENVESEKAAASSACHCIAAKIDPTSMVRAQEAGSDCGSDMEVFSRWRLQTPSTMHPAFVTVAELESAAGLYSDQPFQTRPRPVPDSTIFITNTLLGTHASVTSKRVKAETQHTEHKRKNCSVGQVLHWLALRQKTGQCWVSASMGMAEVDNAKAATTARMTTKEKHIITFNPKANNIRNASRLPCKTRLMPKTRRELVGKGWVIRNALAYRSDLGSEKRRVSSMGTWKIY